MTSSASWFGHRDATVTVTAGVNRAMRDLPVSDCVLLAPGVFPDFFDSTHRLGADKHIFTELRTGAGNIDAMA